MFLYPTQTFPQSICIYAGNHFVDNIQKMCDQVIDCVPISKYLVCNDNNDNKYTIIIKITHKMITISQHHYQDNLWLQASTSNYFKCHGSLVQLGVLNCNSHAVVSGLTIRELIQTSFCTDINQSIKLYLYSPYSQITICLIGLRDKYVAINL